MLLNWVPYKTTSKVMARTGAYMKAQLGQMQSHPHSDLLADFVPLRLESSW